MKLHKIEFISDDIVFSVLCSSYVINHKTNEIIYTEVNKCISKPHTFNGWCEIKINDKIIYKDVEIENIFDN